MNNKVQGDAPNSDNTIPAGSLTSGMWVLDFDHRSSLSVEVLEVGHVSQPYPRSATDVMQVGITFLAPDGRPFFTEVDVDHPYMRATDEQIDSGKAAVNRRVLAQRFRAIADLIESAPVPVAEYPTDLTLDRVDFASLVEVAKVTGQPIEHEHGTGVRVRYPAGRQADFFVEWSAKATVEQIGQVDPSQVGRCETHGVWLYGPRNRAVDGCPVCAGRCAEYGCGHDRGEHGVDGCTVTISNNTYASVCSCRKRDDQLPSAPVG